MADSMKKEMSASGKDLLQKMNAWEAETVFSRSGKGQERVGVLGKAGTLYSAVANMVIDLNFNIGEDGYNAIFTFAKTKIENYAKKVEGNGKKLQKIGVTSVDGMCKRFTKQVPTYWRMARAEDLMAEFLFVCVIGKFGATYPEQGAAFGMCHRLEAHLQFDLLGKVEGSGGATRDAPALIYAVFAMNPLPGQVNGTELPSSDEEGNPGAKRRRGRPPKDKASQQSSPPAATGSTQSSQDAPPAATGSTQSSQDAPPAATGSTQSSQDAPPAATGSTARKSDEGNPGAKRRRGRPPKDKASQQSSPPAATGSTQSSQGAPQPTQVQQQEEGRAS